MHLRLRFLVLSLTPALAMGAEIDFNRDIRPILSNKCLACHGPDEKELKADLRLDSLRGATMDLGGYSAIVPGKVSESELIARVVEEDEDERMPPKGKGKRLDPGEIDLLKRWIAQGAKFDQHWSYQVPQRSIPPKVNQKDWPATQPDHFVLAMLESRGLKPSPPSDKWSLARRAAIDLTGLPPTPEEVATFVQDESGDAYSKYIDLLLAKPAYGEHWARQWLDLARYADSAGYADDPPRTIWAFRDWVIRSINNNIPFDQFTIEQLAGDLLENPRNDQLVATAFHRNTLTNNEGGTNDEEFRNVAVVDRVNTTMQTWMGTTMACAQCHTHKYDPITQNEYFQFLAFFNNTEDADRRNEAPLTQVFTPEQRRKEAELQSEIQKLKNDLSANALDLSEEQKKWETSLSPSLRWSKIQPSSLSASNGVTLESGPDNVILAGGGTPAKSVYTVEFPVTREIRGLRLDLIPLNGSVGRKDNVVINRITATHTPPQSSSGVKGQIVRVELPGNDKFLHLAEVEVFSGERNVARAGKASQISTDFDGPARLAIDGNTNGEYTAKSTSHTGGGQDQWWEVDLGKIQEIDRIILWNRTDGETPGRLAGYRVLIMDQNRKIIWKKQPEEVPRPNTVFTTSGARSVPLVAASADFSQDKFPASAVVNPQLDPGKGWAVAPQYDKRHHLLLLPDEAIPAGGTLRLQIHQESNWPGTAMAKFGISTTRDPGAGAHIRMPAEVRQALKSTERSDKQKELIGDFYRRIAPATAGIQKRIKDLEQQLAALKPSTTVPVMRDLPPGKRRKTHVQIRGNYKQKAEEVSEGVPAVFHPLPKDAPLNRLTLAKWIMSRKNPLTARVIANRQWEALYGSGLVSTSEEFGSQGEYPSHPQLLDWLAVELIESGWDMKKFHKLLVSMSTYRQSSRVTPALLESDPFNRLLTRGPRQRLSAEMVRDQALFAGGLLSGKMYGPPTRPPRPKLGLRAAFGGSTDWNDSTGEDRYRRGIYTEWRRSMPYPSMATFDAPNREVCTVRRSQTNTPLQALVTLNDPVYIETAQALARRAVKETATDKIDQVAAHMFQLALVRPPKASELAPLTRFYEQAYRTFLQDAAGAMALATEPIGAPEQGSDIISLAAWTAVANVVLNLDEIFQKP
ncbi:MAG: hypothetical protein CMO35_03365 [Verrucomicrobiaceae bacterium]|nr:hypothetical protein [Verrucomicrobiaceae bacterium]